MSKQNEENKLDNPVWYSLCETHKDHSIGDSSIKFYHPDYCPFGGFANETNITEAIAEYSSLTDNFFIVGEQPPLPTSLQFKNELVCDQMIIFNKINIECTENIVKLTEEHAEELLQLVNLVQPGYFKKKTASLGNYFGIFQNNMLVAVTGERMQMNTFIEISAVVTHPDHTGKGYAKQLVAHTTNNIFAQQKIPYLHVSATNTGAIQLYKKLGFSLRRKISFWNIEKSY